MKSSKSPSTQTSVPPTAHACERPDRAHPLWRWSLLTSAALLPLAGWSQEALQNLKDLDSAREQRRTQMQSDNYTFKKGDFRLLATPSLGLDWNDNVGNSDFNQDSDLILRPNLQLGFTYPMTQANLLTLNLGVGYDKYFDHTELDAWRVQSGSALSFDIFIKDFTINLHDRVSYSRDSSQEAAVVNTADFGNFENTIGVSTTWALRKATLTASYDHLNVVSIKSTFNSQNRATEMFAGRASFVVHPQLQAGVEGTVSLSSYQKATLNDNANYSGGLFATWQPGSALRISPRAGYTFTEFKGTSSSIQTENLSSYYYDLAVVHDITEVFSYGFSVGHDVRAGIQSDVTEETYVRPTLTWKAFKRASINFGLSYEHGNQGVGNQTGGLQEKYDWFGASVGTSWQLIDRLSMGINYRLTIRKSEQAGRDSTQNMIGLIFTYQPR